MQTFERFLKESLRPRPPEVRSDPVSGQVVIIATDRALRPITAEATRTRPSDEACPFCEGHETETPPEVQARRTACSRPNGPGWTIRVVPNRFPAVIPGCPGVPANQGLFRAAPANGAHEVIIECPAHLTDTFELPTTHVEALLAVYQDRLRAHARDSRLQYGMLFKNVGAPAGASLDHAHAQFLGLPFVPERVQAELAGAQAFRRTHGRCVFCEMANDHERRVLETPHFVVIAPYASRFPFEVWLLPREHQPRFEEAPRLDDLAAACQTTLRKLKAALGDPPYNYLIHTAPWNAVDIGHYHWHIEVLPRLTLVAGFEWGTGVFINPVPPEQAAACLRDIQIGD